MSGLAAAPTGAPPTETRLMTYLEAIGAIGPAAGPQDPSPS